MLFSGNRRDLGADPSMYIGSYWLEKMRNPSSNKNSRRLDEKSDRNVYIGSYWREKIRNTLLNKENSHRLSEEDRLSTGSQGGFCMTEISGEDVTDLVRENVSSHPYENTRQWKNVDSMHETRATVFEKFLKDARAKYSNDIHSQMVSWWDPINGQSSDLSQAFAEPIKAIDPCNELVDEKNNEVSQVVELFQHQSRDQNTFLAIVEVGNETKDVLEEIGDLNQLKGISVENEAKDILLPLHPGIPRGLRIPHPQICLTANNACFSSDAIVAEKLFAQIPQRNAMGGDLIVEMSHNGDRTNHPITCLSHPLGNERRDISKSIWDPIAFYSNRLLICHQEVTLFTRIKIYANFQDPCTWSNRDSDDRDLITKLEIFNRSSGRGSLNSRKLNLLGNLLEMERCSKQVFEKNPQQHTCWWKSIIEADLSWVSLFNYRWVRISHQLLTDYVQRKVNIDVAADDQKGIIDFKNRNIFPGNVEVCKILVMVDQANNSLVLASEPRNKEVNISCYVTEGGLWLITPLPSEVPSLSNSAVKSSCPQVILIARIRSNSVPLSMFGNRVHMLGNVKKSSLCFEIFCYRTVRGPKCLFEVVDNIHLFEENDVAYIRGMFLPSLWVKTFAELHASHSEAGHTRDLNQLYCKLDLAASIPIAGHYILLRVAWGKSSNEVEGNKWSGLEKSFSGACRSQNMGSFSIIPVMCTSGSLDNGVDTPRNVGNMGFNAVNGVNESEIDDEPNSSPFNYHRVLNTSKPRIGSMIICFLRLCEQPTYNTVGEIETIQRCGVVWPTGGLKQREINKGFFCKEIVVAILSITDIARDVILLSSYKRVRQMMNRKEVPPVIFTIMPSIHRPEPKMITLESIHISAWEAAGSNLARQLVNVTVDMLTLFAWADETLKKTLTSSNVLTAANLAIELYQELKPSSYSPMAAACAYSSHSIHSGYGLLGHVTKFMGLMVTGIEYIVERSKFDLGSYEVPSNAAKAIGETKPNEKEVYLVVFWEKITSHTKMKPTDTLSLWHSITLQCRHANAEDQWILVDMVQDVHSKGVLIMLTIACLIKYWVYLVNVYTIGVDGAAQITWDPGRVAWGKWMKYLCYRMLTYLTNKLRSLLEVESELIARPRSKY